jgi:ABC-type uncharacterized transport system involved in gliding motility auxiliary subunit
MLDLVFSYIGGGFNAPFEVNMLRWLLGSELFLNIETKNEPG